MAREGKVSGLNAASHYDAAMSVFPWYERAIYALVMAVLWVFSKLMWRWSVDAPSRLPERVEGSTGSVVICNHTSMAEVVALVPYLWARGHRVRPIFKSEFNKIGIARWAFALAGGIPVERGEADMAALRAARTCSSSPRAPASAPMTSPSRSTAASRSSRRWARPGSCPWPYAGFAM
mgnify:CR=1 FL=1